MLAAPVSPLSAHRGTRPEAMSSQSRSWLSAAKGKCQIAWSMEIPYFATRAARQSCQAGRAFRLLGRQQQAPRWRFA
jgi:hypothetical protein